MTLAKLIKQLQKLEAAGWGRASVAVNKDSLYDGNGTFNICNIEGAEAAVIEQCDGDGFYIENKDGSMRQKSMIVFKGQSD